MAVPAGPDAQGFKRASSNLHIQPMNNLASTAWNVSRSPLPQGQSPYSSEVVSVTLHGHTLTAKKSRGERLKAWLFQHRRALWSVAAVAGPLVLGLPHIVGGVALVVSAATAAGAALGAPAVGTPAVVEGVVAEVLEVTNETTLGDVPLVGRLNANDLALSGFVRDWVWNAKLHFGELKDTSADRICLKRWLGEQMKASGSVRTCDAVHFIPTIVELVFIPGIAEVLAARVAQSGVARLMRTMGGQAAK